MEEFDSPQAMLEDIGKPVRTMPQIKIDGKLVGGYNQLVEYFADMGKVNFKGENYIVKDDNIIPFPTNRIVEKSTAGPPKNDKAAKKLQRSTNKTICRNGC